MPVSLGASYKLSRHVEMYFEVATRIGLAFWGDVYPYHAGTAPNLPENRRLHGDRRARGVLLPRHELRLLNGESASNPERGMV